MDQGRPPHLATALLATLSLTGLSPGGAPLPAPPGSPELEAGGPQETPTLRGRVVVGTDSTALAGQTVVLHRITSDSGFVVDSAVSAEDGGFRFPLPATGDSVTVHIVSARYRGPLYFGPAIHGGSVPDPYLVAVYDTASAGSGASLVVRRRTLALMTEASGTRVLDVTEVSSEAGRTLVGSAPGEPWWRMSLPDGAQEPTVLPGGVRDDQVVFGADEVRVAADVPPSGQRVVLGYGLPSVGSFVLALDHPVASLEVVHRGEGRVRPVAGLGAASPAAGEGGRFDRFAGSDLAAGDTVRLELVGDPSSTGGRVAWVLLGVAGLLAVAAWLSWRRLQGPRGSDSPDPRTEGAPT